MWIPLFSLMVQFNLLSSCHEIEHYHCHELWWTYCNTCTLSFFIIKDWKLKKHMRNVVEIKHVFVKLVMIFFLFIEMLAVFLISLVLSMMIENMLSPIIVSNRLSIKSAVIFNNLLWMFQEAHWWWRLSCIFNLFCNYGISLHLIFKNLKKFPRLISDYEPISCQSS